MLNDENDDMQSRTDDDDDNNDKRLSARALRNNDKTILFAWNPYQDQLGRTHLFARPFGTH